jgi:hypothetical protein
MARWRNKGCGGRMDEGIGISYCLVAQSGRTRSVDKLADGDWMEKKGTATRLFH